MKKINEEGLLSEHVKKIMYRAGYTINETPKYRTVIEDNAEFDEIPPEILNGGGGMTQTGQPQPNAGGGTDAYLEEADLLEQDLSKLNLLDRGLKKLI